MTTTTRNRTAERLEEIRREGRSALVGYLPVGYPDLAGSVDAAREVVAAGADVVELGIPYSDPVMDGPVIQAAVDRALSGGFRVRQAFEAVEAVAATGAPVLVMTYWNPVVRYGIDAFARDLASAGGAGLITPDLIPDEAGEWIEASETHGLDRVFLVAPNSTAERLALTASATRGFVYAASTMGVTGTRESVGSDARRLVEDTRRAGATNVCVGLGVANGDQAAEVAGYADGVIVGSALVRAIGDGTLSDVTADLAAGVRRGRA